MAFCKCGTHELCIVRADVEVGRFGSRQGRTIRFNYENKPQRQLSSEVAERCRAGGGHSCRLV